MATVNDVTLKHLLEHKGPGSVIEKYAELGKLVSGLSGHPEELAHKGIEYLKGLEQRLNIPKLSDFGVGEEHFEAILQNTGQKNHPVPLPKSDLKLILRTRL
jgi:alcohol dehydrogenase class IV